MIDIFPAIRTLLLGNPAVNAAVGGARIYPVVLPQGVSADSIVQTLITEASDYHNVGPSGLGTARVQFDHWSLTRDGAVTLGNLAYDVLSGFSGTVGGAVFRGAFADIARDDFDSVARLYSRRRDFIFWYAEF